MFGDDAADQQAFERDRDATPGSRAKNGPNSWLCLTARSDGRAARRAQRAVDRGTRRRRSRSASAGRREEVEPNHVLAVITTHEGGHGQRVASIAQAVENLTGRSVWTWPDRRGAARPGDCALWTVRFYARGFERRVYSRVIVAVMRGRPRSRARAGDRSRARERATSADERRSSSVRAIRTRCICATTFGLLISHDDGCTFNWVCEQNIGYGGEFDPKYAIATDGTIFATTFRACASATTAAAGSRPRRRAAAGDPAASPNLDRRDRHRARPARSGSAPRRAASRTTSIVVDGQRRHVHARAACSRRRSGGRASRSRRANAQRVYITGYQVADRDGGQIRRPRTCCAATTPARTWTPSPLDRRARTASTPIVLVEAVDPPNPDIVYLMSLGARTRRRATGCIARPTAA